MVASCYDNVHSADNDRIMEKLVPVLYLSKIHFEEEMRDRFRTIWSDECDKCNGSDMIQQ